MTRVSYDNTSIIYDVVSPSSNRMADSLRLMDINLVQKENEYKNLQKEIALKTSGHTIYSDPGLGTTSIKMVTIVKPGEKRNNSSEKFLLLGYLGLRNRSHERFYPEYRFYTKNDTAFIAHLIFNASKNNKGEQVNTYKYEDAKKVNYFYSIQENAQGIMIPVKSGFLKTLYKIILWIFSILLLMATVFIFVTTIIVILQISKGKAFSELNIIGLKWLAIISFITTALPYLFNAVFYLIYFKDFYPQVTFTHSLFDSDYKVFLVAIIYWVLYLAFRKGYKLQQENDLTV